MTASDLSQYRRALAGRGPSIHYGHVFSSAVCSQSGDFILPNAPERVILTSRTAIGGMSVKLIRGYHVPLDRRIIAPCLCDLGVEDSPDPR